MKFVAIIPSRYSSSRFPGKPLAPICGKPMIQRVYENVAGCAEISSVHVATDDERIFRAVEAFGGSAVMTSTGHACGTDRLAECAERLRLSGGDVVLNIQGDEPLVRAEMIRDLVRIFDDRSVYMGTLKKEIMEDEEIENRNVVKVVSAENGDAIYFSRAAVPFRRNGGFSKVYKHVGVYGYTKDFLMKFSALPKTPLEQAESLEQLRAIEHGYKIRVGETRWQTIGVDTPEQLLLVERLLKEGGAR